MRAAARSPRAGAERARARARARAATTPPRPPLDGPPRRWDETADRARRSGRGLACPPSRGSGRERARGSRRSAVMPTSSRSSRTAASRAVSPRRRYPPGQAIVGDVGVAHEEHLVAIPQRDERAMGRRPAHFPVRSHCAIRAHVGQLEASIDEARLRSLAHAHTLPREGPRGNKACRRGGRSPPPRTTAGLQRRLAALAGTDSQRLVDGQHEHLSVADLPSWRFARSRRGPGAPACRSRPPRSCDICGGGHRETSLKRCQAVSSLR